MSTGRLLFHRHFVPSLAAVVFLTLLAGSEMGGVQKAALQRMGQVMDWSTNHILYPQGASLRALALSERDPRAYWNYLRLMRSASMVAHPILPRHPVRPIQRPRPHGDWSVSLGGGGTAADMYPAKFGFYPNATPSCANDYAVYTINADGSATQASIVAFNNLYSGVASATTVAIAASPAGATETGMAVTITTTSAHGFVVNETVTVAGVGVAGYNGTWVVTSVPTTTTFTYTNSASGLATSGGGTAAEGGSSCGTNTAPTVTWAYRLSPNNLTLPTSPILSLDGTKVAFVDGANPALFHVLTPVAGQGTVGAPKTAIAQIADVTMGAGGASDSISSPFMDYYNDIAYVGTDNGGVYKIHPVFLGTPPAAATLFAQAGSGILSGPVINFTSGNVFVGSADGHLYGFNSAGAAITNSPLAIGDGSAEGHIFDSPMVDNVNNLLYVVTGENHGGGGATAIVAQIVDGGSGFGTVTTEAIGPNNVAPIHAGAFNNAYFVSGTSSSWSFYVCGVKNGGKDPELWQVPFTAARVITTPTALLTLSGNNNEVCSPLTEFFNNGVDQLFVGLPTLAEVLSFNITTAPSGTLATAAEPGGTSAIIVDNVGTLGEESSIYFSTLASTTCATSTITPSPVGAKELAGTTVTITTTAAHGFGIGESVTIAGVGVAGYNGTWVVTSVPTSTTFQYTAATSPLANSGGGTATASGFCAVKLTQGALQ